MENKYKLDRENVEDILALTPLQASMLFHYFSDPKSRIYFDQACYRLKGHIRIEALKKAWSFVIENNEMLRTVFRWKELKHPVQIVLKKYEFPITEYDLSHFDNEEREKHIERIREEDRQELVDVEIKPFRVLLCKQCSDEYEMIISAHHAIFDGWSNAILLKELFYAFNEFMNGREPQKKAKAKYKELIKWYQKQDKDKQKSFWENYLKECKIKPMLGKGPSTNLRVEKPQEYSFILKDELVEQMYGYARNNEITIASLIYTAWGILLSKYNGYKDIVFGITMSGRPSEIRDIESIIGLFINTLPLRVRISPEKHISKLIQEVNNDTVIFEEYAGTSLQDIKRYSSMFREGQLFDSILVLQNYPIDEGLQDKNNNMSISIGSTFYLTNFRLTLSIKTFKGIKLDFSFNKADFCLERIKEICKCFTYVISAIVGDRSNGLHIDEVDIFVNDEKLDKMTKMQAVLNELKTLEEVNFDEIF